MALTDNKKRTIKALMVECEITNKAAAKQAGVSEAVISRMLSPMQPKEKSALKAVLGMIKKKRPEIIIEELLND
jgi:predicted transcriptional regulator